MTEPNALFQPSDKRTEQNTAPIKRHVPAQLLPPRLQQGRGRLHLDLRPFPQPHHLSKLLRVVAIVSDGQLAVLKVCHLSFVVGPRMTGENMKRYVVILSSFTVPPPNSHIHSVTSQSVGRSVSAFIRALPTSADPGGPRFAQMKAMPPKTRFPSTHCARSFSSPYPFISASTRVSGPSTPSPPRSAGICMHIYIYMCMWA